MNFSAPPRVGGALSPTSTNVLCSDDRGRVFRVLPEDPPPLLEPAAALHGAARAGDVALVKSLLPACAGVPVADARGVTPLHVAAGGSALDVVTELLGAPSADVNAATKDGRTPLHFAAAGGHLTVVRALLAVPGVDARAASRDGATVLHWAALGGSAAVVREVLDALGAPAEGDADVSAATVTSAGGLTPVHYAAAGGHADALLVLLGARGGADAAAAPDACGWTPLHHAAVGGHVDVVRALLGAPGGAASARAAAARDRVTPLFLAAANGRLRTVAALLGAPGVDASATAGEVRDTPLHHAALGHHTAVVAALTGAVAPIVDRQVCDSAAGRARVEVRNALGMTPLHYAATGDPNTVRALLDAGADVSVKSNDGTTPLWMAAYYARVDVVRALLAAGADATTADDDGLTPLHAALGGAGGTSAPLSGYADVVRALLAAEPPADAGAADVTGASPLFNASRCGQVDAVRAMLGSPSGAAAVNARNGSGLTPLGTARVRAHAAVIEMLVAAGGVE